MASVDLYVVAAGNGSRINLSTPKALVPIAGEPCLTTTLRSIGSKFSRVFVVTNERMADSWCAYFEDFQEINPHIGQNVINLPIQSGLGDGHAALQGILSAEKLGNTSEEIVVAWGDVFFPNAEIIDELLSARSAGSGLLPVILERDPYVSIHVNSRMQCVSADFSRYGEGNPSGFHDQSVFRFSRARLRSALCNLHNCLWKNGRYITSAGELTFLYSIHHLYNAGRPAYAYETKHRTLTFNTADDVLAVRRELGLLSRDPAQLECTALDREAQLR